MVKTSDHRPRGGLKRQILSVIIPVILGMGVLGVAINYFLSMDSAARRIEDHMKGRRMDINFIVQLPTLKMFMVDRQLGLIEEAELFRQETQTFVADYLSHLSPSFDHSLQVIGIDGNPLLYFKNGKAVLPSESPGMSTLFEPFRQMRPGTPVSMPDYQVSTAPDQQIIDRLPLYNELNGQLIGGIVYQYGIPVKELLSPVKKSLLLNAALASGSALILLIVTYWVLEINIRPLHHLTSLVQKMMEGDLSRPVMVTGRGETEILARSFDSMRHRIKNQIDLLTRNTEKLSDLLAQNELAKAQLRKFRTIADRSHYGSAIYNLDRHLTYINDAYLTMHGYEPGELSGSLQSVFFGPDQAAEQNRLDGLLSDQGFITAEETVHVRKDGSVIPILLNSIMVLDEEGSPVFLSETVIDISEKKLLQEQLQIRQRMDSLGTLAGGIAHDFNNLLSAISGYFELLGYTSSNFTESQLRYLSNISISLTRATELIHQIQTLSHGTLTEKNTLDLSTVAAEVFNMLENTTDRLIKKENTLEKGQYIVMANHTEISQVFLNLGVNASEAIVSKGATPEDSIRLSAQIVTIKEGEFVDLSAGNYVHLKFSDTGCGMDETVKSKAFDPLYSTKQMGQQKGQGLGLAMVFNIIKNHGGHIAIETAPQKGTCFHIYLALAVSRSIEKTDSAHGEMLPGTETILLADDEFMIRDLCVDFLEPLGYQIITASDGQEALKIYKEKSTGIDLVIMDLLMPVMSGEMLFKEIMTINPDEKIIISSGQGEGDLPAFMQDRVKGILLKPVHMDKMLALIRKILDN